MCPHGYHHNGFMETPALGTQEVHIYIYIYIYIYTCRLYKLINLCWSTGCFVKLHFTPRDSSTGCFVKLHFTKQPVDQHRLINLYNLHV